jgi:hypothetical protein
MIEELKTKVIERLKGLAVQKARAEEQADAPEVYGPARVEAEARIKRINIDIDNELDKLNAINKNKMPLSLTNEAT